MAIPRLTKLELQIMETLWKLEMSSIRHMQQAFPDKDRPAYTTVQTTVYRLEGKGFVRRVKKLGNCHIFEPLISRSIAERRLVEDIIALFGGCARPVVEHMIRSGKLTLEDIEKAKMKFTRVERTRERTNHDL
jgi:BlaI family transcriptional regulator, penicillinase repressor